MPLSEGFKEAVTQGSNVGQDDMSPFRYTWADIEDQFSPPLWERIEDAVDKLALTSPRIDAPCLYVKWGHDDERDFPEVPSELTVRSSVTEGDWNLIRCDNAVLVQPTPDQGAGPAIFWYGPKPKPISTSTPEGYDREINDGSEPNSSYTNQDGPTLFKGKDGEWYRD